ncbi:hypothetical protein EDEG_02960 [Edhazardia aedis USNM 41457]|uniref:Uncharacterized protein n=1 Tax=Edhazardia aedis (strain USNM 41457) TaxID=1003232 RepID=J9DJ65_EDHAE|nr:hypothetical protein EDEG_02960 [Edhazardia aedis USNM 41457]|eukprot:EJW02640.1 hypothetical protein EDEG_02960 [Edhazardia aedis USNM 41457]
MDIGISKPSKEILSLHSNGPKRGITNFQKTIRLICIDFVWLNFIYKCLKIRINRLLIFISMLPYLFAAASGSQQAETKKKFVSVFTRNATSKYQKQIEVQSSLRDIKDQIRVVYTIIGEYIYDSVFEKIFPDEKAMIENLYAISNVKWDKPVDFIYKVAYFESSVKDLLDGKKNKFNYIFACTRTILKQNLTHPRNMCAFVSIRAILELIHEPVAFNIKNVLDEKNIQFFDMLIRILCIISLYPLHKDSQSEEQPIMYQFYRKWYVLENKAKRFEARSLIDAIFTIRLANAEFAKPTSVEKNNTKKLPKKNTTTQKPKPKTENSAKSKTEKKNCLPSNNQVYDEVIDAFINCNINPNYVTIIIPNDEIIPLSNGEIQEKRVFATLKNLKRQDIVHKTDTCTISTSSDEKIISHDDENKIALLVHVCFADFLIVLFGYWKAFRYYLLKELKINTFTDNFYQNISEFSSKFADQKYDERRTEIDIYTKECEEKGVIKLPCDMKLSFYHFVTDYTYLIRYIFCYLCEYEYNDEYLEEICVQNK